MARVLVTGGVRSGKSRHAESLLDPDRPAVYLTPGYPPDPAADPEWAARVAAHQLRRPRQWRTVETLDLAGELRDAEAPVIIDCLGTWVTRLLDSWQAWDSARDHWQPLIAESFERLAAAVAECQDVVLVTNEVGWGLVSEHRSGRIFADQLGLLNARIATECDEVVLLVAGRPLRLPAF